MSRTTTELLETYLPVVESMLNTWMVDNEYKEVKLEGDVLKNLLEEVLCFLSNQSDLSFVMDEIDNDRMLGEYDWCESTAED